MRSLDADDGLLGLQRLTVGVCLILAPLGQLVANVIRPRTPTEPAAMLEVIAANESAYLASIFVSILAFVLYVPAAAGLWRLMHGRGALTGTVGAGLLAAGAVGLACFLAVGFMYLEMVDPAADRQEMVALLDRYGQSSGFYFLFGLFLVGFQLGSLLLAIGLRLTRAVPAWVSFMVLLAAVGSAVTAPFGLAEIVSAAFLTAGLGATGVLTLRSTNGQWARGVVSSDS
jgi:hypothetical protein